MARSLEFFWELLETNFPLGGPRRHLQELLGEGLVEDLETSGILAQRRVADTYPCPRPGGDNCPRVVIELSDGSYVAVCGNEPAQCAELALAAHDVAHLSVGPKELCSAAARAFKIRGRPEAVLGVRHAYRVGTFIPEPGVRHAVYLAVRCQPNDYAEALDALRSRGEGGAFAVLVPTERFLAEATLRQMATLGIPVLPVGDVVGLDATGFVAQVDPVRYLQRIGVRGAGPAPATGNVVAQALVCAGDGSPKWRDLDERGYQELAAAAAQYEVFADEQKKRVEKGPASSRESKTEIQPSYFRMIRAAVSKRGHFDPSIDSPDEDQGPGKHICQRARKALDIKYTDARGKTVWKLFKSVRVEHRAEYHFNPDTGVRFAFVFLPDS